MEFHKLEGFGRFGQDATGTGHRPSADGFAAVLKAALAPADFWDRPDHDWPAACGTLNDVEAEEFRDANSAYRIGSAALRRDDLQRAQNWFTLAAERQHPGAAFRMAATYLRLGDRDKAVFSSATGAGKTYALGAIVWEWLSQAALWGHGDARHLIPLSRSHDPDLLDQPGDTGQDISWPADDSGYSPEDPEFYAEVRDSLMPHRPENTAIPPETGADQKWDSGCGKRISRQRNSDFTVRLGFREDHPVTSAPDLVFYYEDPREGTKVVLAEMKGFRESSRSLLLPASTRTPLRSLLHHYSLRSFLQEWDGDTHSAGVWHHSFAVEEFISHGHQAAEERRRQASDPWDDYASIVAGMGGRNPWKAATDQALLSIAEDAAGPSLSALAWMTGRESGPLSPSFATSLDGMLRTAGHAPAPLTVRVLLAASPTAGACLSCLTRVSPTEKADLAFHSRTSAGQDVLSLSGRVQASERSLYMVRNESSTAIHMFDFREGSAEGRTGRRSKNIAVPRPWPKEEVLVMACLDRRWEMGGAFSMTTKILGTMRPEINDQDDPLMIYSL